MPFSLSLATLNVSASVNYPWLMIAVCWFVDLQLKAQSEPVNGGVYSPTVCTHWFNNISCMYPSRHYLLSID